MNTAIYTGLVVVLLMSVLFLGPGLFSERTDYPIISWAKKKLRERRERNTASWGGDTDAFALVAAAKLANAEAEADGDDGADDGGSDGGDGGDGGGD